MGDNDDKTGKYRNCDSFMLLFGISLIRSTDLCSPRYIERFRHGPPQSRGERQQIDSAVREKQLPFWWMSPSSLPPSSTPTKATDKGTFSLTTSALFFNIMVINCYQLLNVNLKSNHSG